jgi:hypothetical protein
MADRHKERPSHKGKWQIGNIEQLEFSGRTIPSPLANTFEEPMPDVPQSLSRAGVGRNEPRHRGPPPWATQRRITSPGLPLAGFGGMTASATSALAGAEFGVLLPRPHGGPGYWITSSAVANSVWGMVRPRVLAVLRLMTNSSLVALLTGRSPGFWPLRMRPV